MAIEEMAFDFTGRVYVDVRQGSPRRAEYRMTGDTVMSFPTASGGSISVTGHATSAETVTIDLIPGAAPRPHE